MSMLIRLLENGPILVTGAISVILDDGTAYPQEQGSPIALCRCGKSKNKPFCDGQHVAEEVGLPGGEIE